MGTIEWHKWNIFMLTICLLIGWNYWAPLAVVNPFSTRNMPFIQYGLDSVDFHTYYLAGKSWLSQGNAYAELKRLNFIYPPPSLPFFGLFALLDFKLASTLWIVTYFSVCAIALLALAVTLVGRRKYAYVSIAVLLLLTSWPVFVLFQLGQIDLLVSSLTILSLVSQRKNHLSASAALLSAATLLKGTSCLFLIYFVLFRRDLQYLVRFSVSTLIIIGASLIVVPVRLYGYYVMYILPTLSSPFPYSYNQSIPGLLAFSHMTEIASVVSAGGFGLFVIFSLWVSSKKMKPFLESALRADAMFLMNAAVMLLFGPRSTVYPYVWIILPLALFLSALLVEQVKKQYFILVCVATLLLNAVLAPDFLDYRTLPLALIGNVILTISLIPIFLHPHLVISNAQ